MQENETKTLRRRGKGGLITKGYLRTVTIALGVMAILLGGLLVYLNDYQKNLPGSIAQQVVEAFKKPSPEFLASHSKNLPSVFQNTEVFRKYLADNISATDVFAYRAGSGEEGGLRYEIFSGKRKIATTVLQHTNQKSLFQFDRYELQNIEQHPLFTYTITAPESAQITLNGQPIDPKYLTATEAYPTSYKDIKGLTAPQRLSYKIGDFNYITDLSASCLGKPCQVDWNKETGAINIAIESEETLKKEIAAYTEKVAKVYTHFATTSDAPKAPILAYVYPGTPFYKKLLSYETLWGQSYDKSRYDNMQISNIQQYSATTFSCDIQYNFVISRSGKEKKYPFGATYFLTNQGGKMRVIDMKVKG